MRRASAPEWVEGRDSGARSWLSLDAKGKGSQGTGRGNGRSQCCRSIIIVGASLPSSRERPAECDEGSGSVAKQTDISACSTGPEQGQRREQLRL
ncbi:hypothetical protein chiPu_0007794 [Chiloscyllium punctatum]|uniref:Uncharacterized protein n=1 Tax=Chiloscyllium punctatum TaxID=137246 RepID=A0A401SG58_CHIPU|nr:hypothetical protein [Chiloscyllium punctatum]